jgi:hypothetical protein
MLITLSFFFTLKQTHAHLTLTHPTLTQVFPHFFPFFPVSTKTHFFPFFSSHILPWWGGAFSQNFSIKWCPTCFRPPYPFFPLLFSAFHIDLYLTIAHTSTQEEGHSQCDCDQGLGADGTIVVKEKEPRESIFFNHELPLARD